MEIANAGTGSLRAKFFRDDDQGRDFVEVSIVGDPNTVVRKVKPDDIKKFPREWEAYESGQGEVKIEGTSLLEVPGVDNNQAMAYRLANVRTAEELAELDDAATRGLGMGAITHRKAAILLLKANAADAAMASKVTDTEPATPQPAAARTGQKNQKARLK